MARFCFEPDRSAAVRLRSAKIPAGNLCRDARRAGTDAISSETVPDRGLRYLGEALDSHGLVRMADTSAESESSVLSGAEAEFPIAAVQGGDLLLGNPGLHADSGGRSSVFVSGRWLQAEYPANRSPGCLIWAAFSSPYG